MYQIQKSVLLTFAVLMVSVFVAIGQNQNPNNLTNSPYTRYGYGKLGSVGNATTRAMGDIGIGLRGNGYTNLHNPASLTSIDTLTMLFDVGLQAEFANQTEDGSRHRDANAGFSYVSFHFPLWGGWGMGLSLSPYSMVGYEFGSEVAEPVKHQIVSNDTLRYTNSYSGTGGLNKAMMSIAWRPYRSKTNQLNVGADLSYIWGNVSHAGSILISSGQSNSAYITREYTARGLDAQLGMQYSHLISAQRMFTIGAVFSPQTRLDLDANYQSFSGTDTLRYSIDHKMKTPMSWGIGATYEKLRRLTVGIDYRMDYWGEVDGLNTKFEKVGSLYKNVQRVALGLEYQPQLYSQSFLKVCRYRAGANWKNSYIETYGSQTNEFSVSAGMGIPCNKRSMINFTIDYTHVQPSKSGLISEDYLRLTLGITFNEIMFFRGKLN